MPERQDASRRYRRYFRSCAVQLKFIGPMSIMRGKAVATGETNQTRGEHLVVQHNLRLSG